jgi:nucleoside-diphosphate-sugar epimerase
MKILVTGNLGYIGSVLTDILTEKGIDFVGYDIGYFESCLLYKTNNNFYQIRKDIRDVESDDLGDISTIIHLSALSNDPIGEFNSKITREINLDATINLAKLAKKIGVKRFIYISSQSMYGIANTNLELDEYDSEKNPVTEYAKTKWEAEVGLKKLSDNNFSVISLRPSTVFGASPRLRCDIVFNNLVACAYTTGKIEIKSDGSPWRPVVHVRDVCSAILASLKAPAKLIEGKAFNVGIYNGNYSIKTLAEVVNNAVEGSILKFTNEHPKDSRTYKVSFNRILSEFKDYYKPEWDLEKGVIELLDLFKRINLNEDKFRGPFTNRLQHLSKLVKDNKIDNNFRKKI